jgi:3-hydroxypropanoate dehydrogenase
MAFWIRKVDELAWLVRILPRIEECMQTAREEEIALLFTQARTFSAWLDQPVDDAVLHRLYELTRMGPTGGNSQPLRVLFVKSAAEKQKLKEALAPMNVDKTMSAPVTAIIAWDTAFHLQLPKLFPMRPEMKDKIGGLPPAVYEQNALQSSTLQAGYLILAARALGLDCGPMGGFDAAKVDQLFFPRGEWKTSLLINLGYGDRSRLFPRLPRLDFNEACRIV